MAVLAGQPGWAWAPVDRYTQDGRVYAGCQRSFARRMAAEAARAACSCGRASRWSGRRHRGRRALRPGLHRAGLRHDPADRAVRLLPRGRRGAGARRASWSSSSTRSTRPASSRSRSAAADPVAAADDSVLVRQTIRAVSGRLRLPGLVRPVGGGGGGRQRRPRAPQPVAGRPQPARRRAGPARPDRATARHSRRASWPRCPRCPGWARPAWPATCAWCRRTGPGVYQCWGLENREAALRLVTGSAGEQDGRANLEVKCFDLAANPYLVAGSLIAAGLAGLDAGAGSRRRSNGDPAGLRTPSWTAVASGGCRSRWPSGRLPGGQHDAAGGDGRSAVRGVPRGPPGRDRLFAGASPDDIAPRPAGAGDAGAAGSDGRRAAPAAAGRAHRGRAQGGPGADGRLPGRRPGAGGQARGRRRGEPAPVVRRWPSWSSAATPSSSTR